MDISPGGQIRGTTFVKCPKTSSGVFTIPDGIEEIGRGAFRGCAAITKVNIPEGVSKIGNWAFASCSALTDVQLPKDVTYIGAGAFAECSALTRVHIPNGVTRIPRETFAECSSLADINIPDGVVNIGDWAFSGCKKLAHAIVPAACDIADTAFDPSCKIFNAHSEYRIHLAKELVSERAADGVEVVGMQAPQCAQAVDSRGGRDI